VETEQAHAAVTGRMLDPKYFLRWWKNQEGTELLEHWQTALRPELLRYAFTVLPTSGPDSGSNFGEISLQQIKRKKRQKRKKAPPAG
jgi:hypothetical protein